MKIIFFDIDGTLYHRQDPRKIPQSTKDALVELKEQGNLTVICTGRCMSCIEDDIRNLGFDGYITGCGTHIVFKGKKLWYQVLSADIIQKVNRVCLELGTVPIYEGSRFLYVNKSLCTGDIEKYYRLYQKLFGPNLREVDLEADDICKFTVRFQSDYPEFDCAKQKLSDTFREFGLETLDKGLSLEVYPAGSGKGEGIIRFLSMTGYQDEETYAFGDGINDISMMKEVTHGIALGHSDPKLLEVCQYETKDLYEDGIYHACEVLQLF